MTGFSTPHLEKLKATHENDKLPGGDKPRIEQAIERYHDWVKALDAVTGKTPQERLKSWSICSTSTGSGLMSN